MKSCAGDTNECAEILEGMTTKTISIGILSKKCSHILDKDKHGNDKLLKFKMNYDISKKLFNLRHIQKVIQLIDLALLSETDNLNWRAFTVSCVTCMELLTFFWIIAETEEILRLIVSGTLFPIPYASILYDRLGDVIYYNPVVKHKWNDDGTIKFRVRGTAGGNLLDVPYV
jgi:hypothetical protein